jgi:signal transduction histidine kinase
LQLVIIISLGGDFMTIKQRLRISNMLMIILPMLLTLAVWVISFIYMAGIGGISDRFTAFDRIINYDNISAAGQAIDSGAYTLVADDVALYETEDGSYIVILPDNVSVPSDFDIVQGERVVSSLVFLIFLLIVIYVMNYSLTRYVFRSIIVPIETLVSGVNKIAGGNLEHRIEYGREDEFSTACTAFNKMAQQLSDMVQQKQRDESNRKELIAGISHDLKTPITSIKGHVEGLKKGIASTPEMQEKYLDIIQNKTEDLEYIVRQLFLFSKMDIGEFPFNLVTVDIGKELEKMVDGFIDEYREKGLDISLKENIQGAFVSIDVVQFKNIMQNILDNSLKYSNVENACADLFCTVSNDAATITINDNGQGVSDNALNRLFDIFYREDVSRNNAKTGSGLGLAICSKIIEGLNGSITAVNLQEGGLGTTITLPTTSVLKGEQ